MIVLTSSDMTAVLGYQTEVMDHVATGDPLPSILHRITLALEALIADSQCSILLLDEDGYLRHGAAPSLPTQYSDAVDGLAPGPRAGSCGTAVHLGQPVIASDIATDYRWNGCRRLARRYELGSCWSTPIHSRSEIVGTLAVYGPPSHEPDRRERELVRRFVSLAGMAVEFERTTQQRDARHQADLALQSAESANHAKTQFVTSLSHELRTPLQSITGFTENLKYLDLLPEQRHKALEGIEGAARHILSIVDDVLDLARVEAGSMPIGREPVNAREIAEVATHLLQPLANRRTISLTCSGPPVLVEADSRRLQQVILNLGSNALRFSPEGSSVLVMTEVVDGWGVVHVIDEGPGIPDELLDRLFVPFDRLGADAGNEGGAGLGLVLARGLTEAMRGALTLDSRVGKGTQASIRLRERHLEADD